MTVIGKTASLSAQQDLASAAQRLRDNMRKLSSGKRIDRASDGPAALAQIERLNAQVRSLTRSSNNLQDGVALTRTAEAGLSEVSSQLSRLKELSVQAQNGTLSEADKQVLQEEADQIVAQIDQVAAGTEFNGKELLDGSEGSVEIDAGDGASVSVDTSSVAADALGLSSFDVTSSDAGAAVDAALAQVAERRASLGATERRLTSASRELESRVEQLTGALSRIRDVDVARESSDRVGNELRLQSALAVSVQANLQPKLLIDLLG